MKARYGATKSRSLRRQREKEQSAIRAAQVAEAIALADSETPFDPLMAKLSYNGYKLHFNNPSVGARVVDWQDKIISSVFEPYCIKNIPSPEMLSKLFNAILSNLNLEEIRDDDGVVLWRAGDE